MSNSFEQVEDVTNDELILSPKGNGLAITGLILGILSVVLNLIPFFPYLLAILAVIFSPLGLKSEKRKLAIAGLILGIAAFLLKFGFWFLFISAGLTA